MHAVEPRPDPGFVGRSEELARLVAALEAARSGGSPLCLVLGEAGIGKSRLAGRVAAVADELGYDVAWTEAVEGGGPFSALGGLRLPMTAGDGPSEVEDLRWERLETVAAAVAARAPVLVIAEDLHWADASSQWVVERLARHLRGVAAPIIVTARAEEVDGSAAGRLLAAAEHVVRLRPLSVEDTRLLAERAAPGRPVDGAELWERTGGIPLFVREAAVLAAAGGGPSVASGVLARRFERLGPDTTRVLAAVALAPVGTSLVVLARALGRPVEEVVAAVDVARTEDLVVEERGGGVRFRHALLAEAAVESQSLREQRAFRLALAEALEADGSLAARAAAAEQRVHALPAAAADATDTGTLALGAVVDLRASDRGSEASALAAAAIPVLERYGAAPELVAGLRVELGELLMEFGEVQGAREALEGVVAQDLVLAPTLRARAATAWAWFANPLLPDTSTVERLEEAAAGLPPGDSSLRVRLLGRIAAASVAVPALRLRGRAAADEAVAMARRLGDPKLLVQALADLHLAPTSPEEWHARAAAADEIVALGERLGRPDVSLLGYEWQFGERLGCGDRAGAEESLARLELYAQLSAVPKWRISAGLRRALLLSLGGEREEALDVLEREFVSARQWLHPQELTGVALGFRTAAAMQHDVDDPLLRAEFARHEGLAAEVAAPFVHASIALTAWVVGQPDRARAHLANAAAGLDVLAAGLDSLWALTACGLVAAGLEDQRVSRQVRVLLEPHAGRLTTGSGTVLLPIATTLGMLADVEGDREAAAAFHRQGIALGERVGSPVLVRRCRALAGLDLPGPRTGFRPEAEPGHAIATCGPGGWLLTTPIGSATVEESRGLLQLVEVLRAGGRELRAVDIAGSSGAPVVEHDLGPMLDDRAKREYRARIADLREEIDDAEAMNDPDRGTRARLELDALLDELGRAVGLGGRDRPQGATSERARVNVTRSIRRAIAAIAAQAPALGVHLEVSVRTGGHCSYRPEPAAALAWEVQDAPAPT